MNDTEISGFIKKFQKAEDTFLYGCCYWFALILSVRFGGNIYYDPVNNHFVTKIKHVFYDITGRVDGDFIPWDGYETQDVLHYNRIVKDCINF